MISKILAYFGYVKINREVFELSLMQEAYFERVYKSIPEECVKDREAFKRYVNGQKAITKFLRLRRYV